jgi:hypothetical protein
VTEVRDPERLFLIPFRSTATAFYEISVGIATNETLAFQDAPVGTSWTNYFADGSSDRITIEARESITVPAGTFDCLKFARRDLDNLNLRSTDWVAPGAALVRTVDFGDGEEVRATYELAQYGGQPSDDSADYLPLAEGNQWVYEPGYGDAPRVDTVIGTEQIGDVQTYQLERREAAPDNYHEIRWLAQDDGSTRMHQIWSNEEPIQGEPLLVDPPWTMLRATASTGDQWEERAQVAEYEFSWLISVHAARSVVTVPAGTFENCLVLRTLFTLREDGQPVDQSRNEHWYAPGVGMVLSNSYEDSWSSAPRSQELVSYTVHP